MVPQTYEKWHDPAEEARMERELERMYREKLSSGSLPAVTSRESEPDETATQARIKARIQEAEETAVKHLNWGHKLACALGVAGLLGLAVLIRPRLSGFVAGCSFKRNDIHWKPLVYAAAGTFLYELIAACLVAYLIIPLFSGGLGRLALQTLLLTIGLSVYAVSGFILGRKAANNREGHSVVFAAVAILLNLALHKGEVVFGIIHLLAAGPLIAIFARLPKSNPAYPDSNPAHEVAEEPTASNA